MKANREYELLVRKAGRGPALMRGPGQTDHVEVIEIATGEIALFWDTQPAQTGRLARALRADLAQLECGRLPRQVAALAELLGADPFALGVEERLAGHPAVDPLAEHLDGDLRPGRGVLRGQVGVGDRALDGVAVAAARDAAGDAPVHPDGLVTQRHRARVLEGQAAQPPRGLRDERVAPDEVLVELHREADRALVGRVVGRDVRAPHAVALLQP